MEQASGNTIRVLIVDNFTLVREAIKNILTQQEDFEIVDHVASAEQALQCIDRLLPDIVLMETNMPGMIAFEGARCIRRLYPYTRIIFLSVHCHDYLIDSAINVGAMGYLTKNVESSFLVHAIREVSLGRACFSPEVQSRLVMVNGRNTMNHQFATRISHLTQRQREVLQYIGDGMSKKEMARIMKIEVKTVDKHVENLMRRLDIHDRVGLARFAIREGIVQP